LQVDRHRLLAAVDREVVGGVVADERWPPHSGGVTAVGVLDFGDIGAEIGERHGRVRSGEDLRQVEDLDAGERGRAGGMRAHEGAPVSAVGTASAAVLGAAAAATEGSTSVPSAIAARWSRATAFGSPASPSR